MNKIKTALISVSDKKNLKPVLEILKKNKVKIISSGGTYKEIKKLKFKCTEVSEFTNSPEILEGRVKTLHPKIHAGILNKRKNKIHLKDLKKNNFENIDLVIVNFYPFEETLKSTKNHTKIIENIDVGGPTMVRSAAKNYQDVTVVTSSGQYPELIEELKKNKGSTSLEFREKLSRIAFTVTAFYDSVISDYFNKKTNVIFSKKRDWKVALFFENIPNFSFFDIKNDRPFVNFIKHFPIDEFDETENIYVETSITNIKSKSIKIKYHKKILFEAICLLCFPTQSPATSLEKICHKLISRFEMCEFRRKVRIGMSSVGKVMVLKSVEFKEMMKI